MPRTVLVGSTLLDPSSPRPDPVARTIVIEDGRIADCLAPDAHADGERIDATGLWAIPGLVDARYTPFQHRTVRDAPAHLQSVAQNLLPEQRSLQRWLESGVTSLCSVGAPHNLDIELRDALARGIVRGPRLFAAGCPISAYSGGKLQDAGVSVEASGVDHARRVARDQIKATADLLVACLGAHVCPWADASLLIALDGLEIRAVVDEAQHASVPVYAMCSSPQTMQSAVSAGVNAVVPMYSLDANTMQGAQDSRTALVSVAARLMKNARGLAVAQAVKEAFRDGITFLLGSGSRCEHWRVAEHGRLLVDAGVDPYHVLQALTIRPAQLFGREREFGSLQPGCVADIVLLDRNPADCIANLAEVRVVLQAGRVAYRRKDVEGRDTLTQH